MQLAKKPSIRSTLTAFTSILIGGGIAHAANDNILDSSILLYSEKDRVHATESIFHLRHTIKGDRFLNARLSFDALTGPSPNGAAPSNKIQTFTRPSGAGSYSVKPGETPKDDAFKDSRLGVDGSYTRPLDRLTTLDVGGHLSSEHDYLSIGANIGFSRDFNQRNTTLSVSAAISHDLVSPRGGAPVPFSSMSSVPIGHGNDDEFEHENEGAGENKNVFDAVLGLTQVLDRQTLVRFNYSLNYTSGYLNDPYKLISVVQAQTGAKPGEPVDYLYESRPGSRSKNALFAEARRYIFGHTIDVSFRYFWDDWGIVSHTFDLHYRLPLPGGHALEPHLRWYRQSAADFYRSYLLDGSPRPAFASADYRLAPFHALTIGLQYVFPVAAKTQFSVGAEQYHQAGDISPPDDLGPLSKFDLFPDLKAIMVRAGFSHNF